jgi:hypothetical protein
LVLEIGGRVIPFVTPYTLKRRMSKRIYPLLMKMMQDFENERISHSEDDWSTGVEKVVIISSLNKKAAECRGQQPIASCPKNDIKT